MLHTYIEARAEYSFTVYYSRYLRESDELLFIFRGSILHYDYEDHHGPIARPATPNDISPPGHSSAFTGLDYGAPNMPLAARHEGAAACRGDYMLTGRLQNGLQCQRRI